MQVQRTPASLGLVIALAASTGCSYTYLPRPSPRVSMALRGGAPSFFRDGHEYPGGMFGSGLLDAVHGSPAAEAHARAYRSGSITGFGLAMGGLITVFGGTTAVLATVATSHSTSASNGFVALSVVDAIGLALALAGFFVSMGAEPRLYDAINVYNDSLPDAVPTNAQVQVLQPEAIGAPSH